jgi:hypothetical protein
MAQNTPSANPKGRKLGRNFASFRATFSRSATPVVTEQQKPAPIVVKSAPNVVKPAPPQPQLLSPIPEKPTPAPKPPAGNLEKRQSKMTLFDLFSKPKVERARGHHEALESRPERSQTPAQFYRRPDELPSQQPMVQSRPASRLLGPIETNTVKPLPSKPPRPPDDWDPPPLFQAYPQSIKHGSVQSTNLSTEVLLRAQHQRLNGISSAFGSTTSLPFVREGGEGDLTPAQESLYNATKRFSTLSQTPELVDKVFVLVTAGRLVQYAGEGNYDRMPEKVLQLGEKSAAFACDLIPGKHWVVQVVQAANEDGVATINKSRSILSRLRMPTSAARKTSTSFLLVFSSAEDMDGWLRAIRRVIDQLNGKKRGAGEGRHSRQNTAEKIPEALVSHRASRMMRPPSMIQSVRTRSSSTHSHPRSPIESTFSQPLPSVTGVSSHASPAASPVESPQIPSVEEEGTGSSIGRGRVLSSEAPSISTTIGSISTDQLRLDQLRESSRHSLVSVRTSRTSETESATVATSQGSSSPPSPHRETFSELEVPRMRSSYMGGAPAYSGRRMSSQPNPVVQPTALVLPVERVTRIQSQKYTAPETSDLFWLTKPTPVPSTIPEYPRSRPLEEEGVPRSRTRTLKALSSDPPVPFDSDVDEEVKSNRRDSTVGQLPLNLSSHSLNRLEQAREPRSKPFFRPLPVRPSEPAATATNPKRISASFGARRFSSLPMAAQMTPPPGVAPPAAEAPTKATPRFSLVPTILPEETMPVEPTANRPARPRAPSYSLVPTVQPTPQPAPPPQKLLKRPTSMQIRSDPAPFLSSRRPSASYRSSSASPAPAPPSAGYRSSATPATTGAWRAFSSGGGVSAPLPVPMMSQGRSTGRSRTSMPTIMMSGLPPPAPPPSIPLPAPPQSQPVI